MTARQYLETIETHYQSGLKWGAKLEQERIIKLIEENMDHWDGWLDVKALIKGEQKWAIIVDLILKALISLGLSAFVEKLELTLHGH